ncbi:winged helix DNA-binding domain-containing protein [Actinophytocola sp.]|uniref:winged helix DNA-binding domain-containing protein n=1 Tax=Actinophytocola sp. TaxID=1872138 RepID=UPI002ED28B8D
MDVWAVRAHANGLDGRAGSVVDAVSQVVALQGQDLRANRLAVRARTGGLTGQDVDDAVARGEVVRTWAMRGTLHMLAARDLRWVLRAVGAYFRDRQAPRRRQLGLDDAVCERGVAQLEDILTEPLTRDEIRERVDLDLAGQAAPYLLAFAALEGVVCRGPERGSEPTYVLVRDWVTASADDRLALRYLRGHGPAGPRDLAAWSGLPLTTARAAFDEVRDLLEPVGEHFVVSGSELREAAATKLLGHFDAFLLGYGERSVPEGFTRKIQAGGGFVMPAVSVGGRIVGTWRQHSAEEPLAIDVTPFTTMSARLRRELANEVLDLGRFLGRRTSLSVGSPAAAD